MSASCCDEPPLSPVVRAFDETSESAAGHGRIDTERWAALAAAVLNEEGVIGGELGLRFVDPGAMAELNLAHMGAPGPTDVLAFPIDGRSGCAPRSGPAVLLGDVVVCPAYAARAPDCGRPAEPDDTPAPGRLTEADDIRAPGRLTEPDAIPAPGRLIDEVALLVVHGVLHVLGYDHADDEEAAAMQAREGRLLAAHHRPP